MQPKETILRFAYTHAIMKPKNVKVDETVENENLTASIKF